jgi:hypothetical protein
VSADALADADRFRLTFSVPTSAFMFIVVPQGIRDATIAGFRAAVIV